MPDEPDFSHLPKSRAEALAAGEKYYFTGKPCKLGHTTKRTAKHGRCISCKSLSLKIYYNNNKQQLRIKSSSYYIKSNYYTKNKERYRLNDLLYRSVPENRIASLVTKAIQRAKEKHLPYDTKKSIIDYLVSTDYLYCNTPGRHIIDYSTGKGKSNARSPSIDRIDNSKGYTVDNIAIICNDCNKKKSNSSLSDIKNLYEYMISSIPQNMSTWHQSTLFPMEEAS